MTGEYWQKIEAARQDMAEQEQTEAEERAQVAEQRRALRKSALTVVTAMFEDIRANDPQVQAQPLSEVTSRILTSPAQVLVELRWGNKFKLSDEDQHLMRTTDITTMVAHDYSSIGAQIDMFGPTESWGLSLPHLRKPFFREDTLVHWNNPANSRVVSHEYFSLAQFVGDPSIIMPTVVKLLERPGREYFVYQKGVYPDMFKPTPVARRAA